MHLMEALRVMEADRTYRRRRRAAGDPGAQGEMAFPLLLFGATHNLEPRTILSSTAKTYEEVLCL